MIFTSFYWEFKTLAYSLTSSIEKWRSPFNQPNWWVSSMTLKFFTLWVSNFSVQSFLAFISIHVSRSSSLSEEEDILLINSRVSTLVGFGSELIGWDRIRFSVVVGIWYIVWNWFIILCSKYFYVLQFI